MGRRTKKQYGVYSLVYTLLFGIGTAVVFFSFFYGNRSFIWSGDGLHQHYQALMYFGRLGRQVLHSLFTEHRLVLPQWEFGLGYGSNILATLHYYVIGDPLNLISIAVPEVYTEQLYNTLILLRLWLAGLAFSCYCFYMKKTPAATMAGAFCYVFCGFTIAASVRHPYFTNPMIYLPLLLIGMEKIFRGRSPAFFALFVCISAASNFYFFYMLVFACVLYFFVVFFLRENDRTKNRFFKTLLTLAGGGLLGLAMAAVILLPVVWLFLQSARVGVKNAFHVFYRLGYYERLFTTFLSAGAAGYWTELGYAVPVLPAAALLFGKRKENRPLWVGILFLTVLLIFPAAGHVLNGFSYVCNRWVFIYSALLSYCVAAAWTQSPLFRGQEKKKMVIVCAVWAALALCFRQGKSDSTYVSAGLLVVPLLLFIFSSEKNKPWLRRTLSAVLVAVTLVSCGFNAHYRYSPLQASYISEFVENGTATERIAKTPARIVSELNAGSGFVRFEQDVVSVLNASELFGVSSTQYYWSLENGKISRFMRELDAANGRQTQCYLHNNQRTGLNALAAVKYGVYKGSKTPVPYGYEPIGQQDGYTVYENRYALPLGFTYDSYFTRGQYEKLSSAEREAALLQAAMLDESVEGLTQAAPEPQTTEIPFTTTYSDSIVVQPDGSLLVTSSKATATLRFEGLPNCEVSLWLNCSDIESRSRYQLYFDGDEQHFSRQQFYALPKEEQKLVKATRYDQKQIFTINAAAAETTSSLTFTTPYYTWPNGQTKYLLNLGYYEEPIDTITLSFPALGLYRIEGLKVICRPMENYEEQIGRLKENRLENVAIDANTVSGSIRLSQTKLLCLSIPYCEGWSASVDGKAQELLQVNAMYMGLILPPGEHTVELRYRTPGLTAGAALTCLGFAGFVTLCMIRRRRKTR